MARECWPHRPRGGRVDAFIDTYGNGYVKVANELGVAPDRIETIVDFAAAREEGAKAEGSSAGMSAATLAELEVPVAAA